MEKFSDTSLLMLRNLPSLTSLNLSSRVVTDKGLKELQHVSTLVSLDLSFCFNITDAARKELRHMCGLTSLNLSHCYEITDAGLKELFGTWRLSPTSTWFAASTSQMLD